jgi:exosortase
LLFLFFAVPIPGAALERTISLLQAGSAEVAYRLLQATGMPIARDGFVFHLSTLDIEVAPQCSGIRSSLSLVITGILAAYLFLRTGWARTLLMITIVPIAILKNGIRIAVLSSLAIYWDEKILASDLHHKGGVVFFILALLLAGGGHCIAQKNRGSQEVS